MAKQPQQAEEVAPEVVEVQPESEPQIAVLEWATARAAQYGAETVLAFAALFGRDTATAGELESAMAAFVRRPIA